MCICKTSVNWTFSTKEKSKWQGFNGLVYTSCQGAIEIWRRCRGSLSCLNERCGIERWTNRGEEPKSRVPTVGLGEQDAGRALDGANMDESWRRWVSVSARGIVLWVKRGEGRFSVSFRADRLGGVGWMDGFVGITEGACVRIGGSERLVMFGWMVAGGSASCSRLSYAMFQGGFIGWWELRRTLGLGSPNWGDSRLVILLAGFWRFIVRGCSAFERRNETFLIHVGFIFISAVGWFYVVSIHLVKKD